MMLIQTRPAPHGEMWAVVLADTAIDANVAWFAGKRAAVAFAGEQNRTRILAITNKLSWREGDGLELLEEAS